MEWACEDGVGERVRERDGAEPPRESAGLLGGYVDNRSCIGVPDQPNTPQKRASERRATWLSRRAVSRTWEPSHASSGCTA